MPTEVIGDNTGDDYAGTEDCYLQESAPTTNQGTHASIGHRYNPGINQTNGVFSFSGISNLPASLTVSSATLGLYKTSSTASSITTRLQRLLRNWVEAEATWNIWSTGNSWTTAGGTSIGNDRSATTTGDIDLGTTTGYKTLSSAQLAADVEDFADGTYSNYGWISEPISGTTGVWHPLSSSDGTDGQLPYLSVTYTTGGGTTSFPPIKTGGLGTIITR